MIKLNQRDRDGVTILELSGRLMGGPDSDLVYRTLRDLMARGHVNIVIDMGQVAWVNSSGLGILIASYTSLRERGGSLKLLNVSRRIEQILAVTKLNTVFESYDDEDAVVASFGNPAS